MIRRFTNGSGSREALFAYSVLMSIKRSTPTLLTITKHLIVRHKQLIDALKQKNFDKRDIKLIVNLYLHQSASVRAQSELTRAVEIK